MSIPLTRPTILVGDRIGWTDPYGLPHTGTVRTVGEWSLLVQLDGRMLQLGVRWDAPGLRVLAVEGDTERPEPLSREEGGTGRMPVVMVLTDTPCPRCEGRGTLPFPLYIEDEEVEDRRRCDDCRGSGGTWIPLAEAPQPYARTGQSTPGEERDERVPITPADLSRVSRIVEVLKDALVPYAHALPPHCAAAVASVVEWRLVRSEPEQDGGAP